MVWRRLDGTQQFDTHFGKLGTRAGKLGLFLEISLIARIGRGEAADVGTQVRHAPGKIFVTSRRLIFAGGRVQAWPWHRVRRIVRIERALVVAIAGGPDGVHLTCNIYGDALVAASLADQIRRRDA